MAILLCFVSFYFHVLVICHAKIWFKLFYFHGILKKYERCMNYTLFILKPFWLKVRKSDNLETMLLFMTHPVQPTIMTILKPNWT
jgi:hypothetical protein